MIRKKQKVFKLDQGGAENASLLRYQVKNLRLNLFNYSGWPFQDQTPEDLELLLYDHQGVAVFKIENKSGESKNYFAPITLTRTNTNIRITKLNAGYMNVSIASNSGFNSKIIDSFKINDNDYKEQLPFIFDNFSQVSPHTLQKHYFKEYAGVFNATKSNRINKNKQSIIEVENGQAFNKAIELSFSTEDYSPYTIIEKNSKDKKNPMSDTTVKTLTNGVNDLYNSLSTEKKDLEKAIMILNGIRTSQAGEKSSAQETDSQTTDKDRDTIQFIKAMKKSRVECIKNINKYLGTKLKIDYSKSTLNFINVSDQKDLEKNKDK